MKLDKPCTPRKDGFTLKPTDLRQIIQRRRQGMSRFASFLEWVDTVEPGTQVPRRGVTFWHEMGSSRSKTQILPDTFAIGLSTQVNEGSPRAVLKCKVSFISYMFLLFIQSYIL
jgi:hypothetical protein